MPVVWRCGTVAMQATDLTCMHKVVSPGRDRLSPTLHSRTLPAPHLERPRRALRQPQNSRRLLRAADSDLQGAEPHSCLLGRRSSIPRPIPASKSFIARSANMSAGTVATAAAAPSAAAGLREPPAQMDSAAPQDSAGQPASQPAEQSPPQDADTVRRLKLRFASASIPHPDKVRTAAATLAMLTAAAGLGQQALAF